MIAISEILGSRNNVRVEVRRQDDEYFKNKRRKLLTDKVNGLELTDCKICGEYLESNTDCPLINSNRGLCGKSLLTIQYNERTNKYNLFQFGMK